MITKDLRPVVTFLRTSSAANVEPDKASRSKSSGALVSASAAKQHASPVEEGYAEFLGLGEALAASSAARTTALGQSKVIGGNGYLLLQPFAADP